MNVLRYSHYHSLTLTHRERERVREKEKEKERVREKERRQHKERPVEIFQFIFTQAMPLTQIVFFRSWWSHTRKWTKECQLYLIWPTANWPNVTWHTANKSNLLRAFAKPGKLYFNQIEALNPRLFMFLLFHHQLINLRQTDFRPNGFWPNDAEPDCLTFDENSIRCWEEALQQLCWL